MTTSSGSRDPQDGNEPRSNDPLRVGSGLVEPAETDSGPTERRTVTSSPDVGQLDTSTPVPEDGDEKRHRTLGTPMLRGDLLEQREHPTGLKGDSTTP